MADHRDWQVSEGGEPYVEAAGLSKVYPTRQGPVRALHDISLTVRRGEFVSILGPAAAARAPS
jgi:NitT/TauT family transport system ATP-binding protein